MKKYELIEEGNLFRIRALKDFSDVRKGDLGGLVEGGHNLSHIGDCWIYNNAEVSGNARVYDNAKIRDNAKIFEDARVYNNAKIFEKAKVFGYALIFGDASVCESAEVFGFAQVGENAIIFGNAKVYESAVIVGNAKVFDKAKVYGYAQVYKNVKVTKTVITFGNAFNYFITITDDHIRIGCQQHLKAEWKNFSDREILEMDGKEALKFWRVFKPIVEKMNLFN